MKYLVAAILLVATALAYPTGEKEGEQQGVPLVISDAASVSKADESGNVHSHEHHAERHGDVSHEIGSPKVEHDSNESSDESNSSESAEKPNDQAKPEEPKEKTLLDEKVEHQAQPSEIINSEVAHPEVSQPAQDPIKVENVEQVPAVQSEPVALSDLVPISEPEEPIKPVASEEPAQPSIPTLVEQTGAVKIADPVQQSPIHEVPVQHADEPSPQSEVKSSDEKPQPVPEPEAPSSKSIPDEQPEVKQDAPVSKPESVDVIQGKSADIPETREASPEEKKVSDEPKLIDEPKSLAVEPEKPSEDKVQAVRPQDSEKLSDPVPVQVANDPIKPVQHVIADAIPVAEPASDEPADKKPEPETLPEASASS